jgi:hypothetical protein
MQVTALFALLVLLALALAGAGLAAYRLAAWQRQAQDGLKYALVEADAQRERLFAVLHGLLVLDERGQVAVVNEHLFHQGSRHTRETASLIWSRISAAAAAAARANSSSVNCPHQGSERYA